MRTAGQARAMAFDIKRVWSGRPLKSLQGSTLGAWLSEGERDFGGDK